MARFWCHHAPPMPIVFVYGPDSLQARIYDRLGSSNALGGAVLEGFSLKFNKPNMKNKDEGLANVQDDPSGSIFGVVYELSRAQLETLEGYYGGYSRRDIIVQLQPAPAVQGEPPPPPPKKMEAVMLIARRTQSGLRPSKTSLDATVKGAEENGAPRAFIDGLKKVEALRG
jgi:hypothetical protein